MTDHADNGRIHDLLNQPDWMQQAACKGLADLMFPTRGELVKEAKAVCLGSDTTKPCPVLKECRVYAMEAKVTWGILGGWSERERRRMRRERRAA